MKVGYGYRLIQNTVFGNEPVDNHIGAYGFETEEAAVNMLFPARCAICDDVIAPGERYICKGCAGKMSFVTGLYSNRFSFNTFHRKGI